MVLLKRARRCRLLAVGLSLGLGAFAVPAAGVEAAPFMSGKGTATESSPAGAHGTASYAYNIPCNAPAGSSPPFEIRVTGGPLNGQRFRVTSVDGPFCRNNPLAPTPPAGFNMLGGLADVSSSLGGGFDRIGFSFVDGGPGGANDTVAFVLVKFPARDPANFIQFGAAPPGKFPGSDQPTGFNTAHR